MTLCGWRSGFMSVFRAEVDLPDRLALAHRSRSGQPGQRLIRGVSGVLLHLQQKKRRLVRINSEPCVKPSQCRDHPRR